MIRSALHRHVRRISARSPPRSGGRCRRSGRPLHRRRLSPGARPGSRPAPADLPGGLGPLVSQLPVDAGLRLHRRETGAVRRPLRLAGDRHREGGQRRDGGEVPGRSVAVDVRHRRAERDRGLPLDRLCNDRSAPPLPRGIARSFRPAGASAPAPARPQAGDPGGGRSSLRRRRLAGRRRRLRRGDRQRSGPLGAAAAGG